MAAVTSPGTPGGSLQSCPPQPSSRRTLMKISRLAGIAALLAAGFTQAQAQDVKVNILTEFWYTQMLDSNLRNNSAQNVVGNYYGLDSRFQENTFNIKRAEIYCNYKISDEWAG